MTSPYKTSPLTCCSHSVNEPVIIRLKWGQTEYHGRLISVDSYMNIQLSNTEEFIDGKSTGTLGQVLIR
jgi:small nuclear ribonucleoprotein F